MGKWKSDTDFRCSEAASKKVECQKIDSLVEFFIWNPKSHLSIFQQKKSARAPYPTVHTQSSVDALDVFVFLVDGRGFLEGAPEMC